MRRISLFCLGFILLTLPWVASNPARYWQAIPLLPSSSGFCDLVLFDLKTGWLLDNSGSVQALDGTSQSIPPGGRSIFFLDRQHGWIVGDAGLFLRTNDGGIHWRAMSFPSRIQLRDAFFHTTRDGWCVGEQEGRGILLHTTDGGQTWQTVDIGSQPPLIAITFQGSVGWIVTDRGPLLYTADRGRSWLTRTPPTAAPLEAVALTPTQVAWFVGDRGTVLSTQDGGQQWQLFDSLLTTHWYDVAFSDEFHGVIVGEAGKMLVTDDGGRTWRQREADTSQALYRVALVKGQRGLAVGAQHTVMDTFNGRVLPLSRRRSIPSLFLTQIQLVDAQRGWVVGSRGTIGMTNDGGISWRLQSSPTAGWLYDVIFLDSQTGWAGGDDGVIVHTIDGGKQWYVQRHREGDRITGLHFVDALRGWAVGQEGLLLRTTNGGRSWDRIPTHWKTYDLADITFATPQEGWIVGRTRESPAQAVVLYTRDGGEQWEDRSGDFQGIPPLWSVAFYQGRRGIMVGDAGTLLLTEDGGFSWYWTQAPMTRTLHRVTYDPEGTPWIVGQGGTLLTRREGEWRVESLPMKRALWGIAVQDGTVYVVGEDASVWRSGPLPPAPPPANVTAESLPSEPASREDPAGEDADQEAGGVDLITAALAPEKPSAPPVVEPQVAPDPQFLWVMRPEEARLGVPFTIEVAVINKGGKAARGNITLAFPDNTRFLVIDHDTQEIQTYAVGDLLWSARSKQRVRARYPVVEAVQKEWHAREVHAITVRLLPTRRGTLRIHVRAALKSADGRRFLLPAQGPLDQQGFPVRSYTIRVR